jgi:hypothetical protein
MSDGDVARPRRTHRQGPAAVLFESLSGREWMVDASCAELPIEIVDELFFPTDNERTPPLVYAMCAACPVRRDCARAGLGEDYGLWGGVSHNRNYLRDRDLVPA